MRLRDVPALLAAAIQDRDPNHLEWPPSAGDTILIWILVMGASLLAISLLGALFIS